MKDLVLVILVKFIVLNSVENKDKLRYDFGVNKYSYYDNFDE